MVKIPTFSADFQALWLSNKLDEWWSWPKEKIGEMESEMHPS